MREAKKKAVPFQGNGSNQNVLFGHRNKVDITTIELPTKAETIISDSSDCRKFISCSAPQCPLDAGSLSTPYYSGEPICLWLLEYAKGNHSQLKSAMEGIPIDVVGEAYEHVFNTYGTIRNRLKRAKLTPSRLSKRHNPQTVENIQPVSQEVSS